MVYKLAPLRGMKDLLPEEYNVHKYIENTAFKTAQLYGAKGIATPIIELANVFDRTLGNTSDVVSKEMYSFHDKKGRLVSLRPEFTACVMRAIISNNLKHKLPLKLFSCGPLFRYDRPQEGRQRQFHQINFENIGVKTPYSDAETILLATHILRNLEILEDLTLEVSSLGCNESRKNYQASLIEYFEKYYNDLSEDSRNRLAQNPLRILDSKDEKDKRISLDAPVITSFYTKDAFNYFEEVKTYLNKLNIKYVLNPRLARGLDYYSHTTFEFTTTKLGAQSTVLAGGRYDGLSKILGESEIPAIGFASGIERIILMKNYVVKNTNPVYIFPITGLEFENAIFLANNLRKENIPVIVELEGKLNKRIQTAVASNALYAIFIGEEELKSNSYKLKNLSSGTEQTYSIEHLIKILNNQKQ